MPQISPQVKGTLRPKARTKRGQVYITSVKEPANAIWGASLYSQARIRGRITKRIYEGGTEKSAERPGLNFRRNHVGRNKE